MDLKVTTKTYDIESTFARLRTSKFRTAFKLTDREFSYLHDKGLAIIRLQARSIICDRLASAIPKNDGKQTPFRNHPVFVAQHATATCCRRCLKKWHGIKMNSQLEQDEIDYVVFVILKWLSLELNRSSVRTASLLYDQLHLFQ